MANIFAEREIFFRISYAAVVVTGLPDLMREAQFFFRPKGKSAFDELHRSLQSLNRSDQQVKVIRHDHKLMQEILSLGAIVKQNVDEQPGHSVRLKNVPLLKCGSGNEVAAISSVAAAGSGHGMHLSG